MNGAGAAESEVGSVVTASRDRGPPPSFDGKNLDDLKRYMRDLRLWRWKADTPKVKHAVKVLRQLSGPARAAADDVSGETIMTEEGTDAILSKLKEHFQPHLEAAMPRAFDSCVPRAPVSVPIRCDC